jgi:hypothetical protein
MKLLGIGLIIFGVVCLIYQGLTIVIPKDVVDLGFLTVTIYEQKTIPLPPIVGGVSLIVGILLILTSDRRGGV